MAGPRQFAVLQKDATSPTAGQLKHVFRSFYHLTDADAVRWAAGARGVLLRHADGDTSRAFQQALQAEGIGAVVVAEDELPKLPEGRSPQRLGISPQAFTIFDFLGRPTALAWADVTLVAAAAVRHFEMGRTEKERTVLRFSPVVGIWPKKIRIPRPQISPIQGATPGASAPNVPVATSAPITVHSSQGRRVAAMCSGVVPQQPPMIRTPIAASCFACAAM